jgi:uncharacterized protein YfiM (DUF2279 family)
MLKLVCLFALLLTTVINSYCQTEYESKKWKKPVLYSGYSLAYVGFSYQMSQHFFTQTPISPFHIRQDWKTWKGMDKFYHAYGSYQLSSIFYQMNKWAGIDSIKSLHLAFLESVIFSTTKEYFDGRVAVGGWSWYDIGMNNLGNLNFYLQQRLLGSQKIQYKFSYFSSGLQAYNPGTLGTSKLNYWMKDYNGETFWLSSSLGDWKLTQHKWLNAIGLTIGYGAHNVISEYSNPPHLNLSRYNQYYLGLDINWQQIETSNKTLKTLFFILNRFRFPLPSLELNSMGKLTFHAFKVN